jgi:MazG family protein
MMMSTLRVQCPWDQRQTLESLQRYLIEESYEVLDTLTRDASPSEHCDELGDLLFQVIFQSKVREEEGNFTLVEVMNGLAAKLARRHPHVFGEHTNLTAEEVRDVWQQVKAQERAQKQAQMPTDTLEPSVLDGIPSAAPALLRAQLIGEKAATIGFDWPSVEGALAKVDEERLEVAEALARGHHQDLISELGDLFFALVNVCRHLNISPEIALERTNQTFGERFRAVEQLASARGLKLDALDIEQLEALWSEVKIALNS